MDKYIVAHELGHAICAEVQDGFWYPSGLSFKKDDGTLAVCFCDKRKERKKNVKGPYSKTSGMMNLGGLFGEMLWGGEWSPWGARADIDEFITMNTTRNAIKNELDEWLWVKDDDLSFRACSKIDSTEARRKFRLDCHNTARRLPALWDAYLDFCDRIDKESFKFHVNEIVSNNMVEVRTKDLKEIMKEIII